MTSYAKTEGIVVVLMLYSKYCMIQDFYHQQYGLSRVEASTFGGTAALQLGPERRIAAELPEASNAIVRYLCCSRCKSFAVSACS